MAIRFDSQWDAASTRSRQFWAFKRDCLAVALGRFGSNRNAACQIEHTYVLKQASRPCLHRCETLQWLDVVVVYKVNRLTRSLADFAKLVELFEANGVSFVAVTQQFNTTTSMGRLTLNVLLSFAQFERELAGERIRDKFAASRAKGMWMGGTIPLGYDVKDRKLVINADEANRVRLI